MILVTGASGLVGRHVRAELKRRELRGLFISRTMPPASDSASLDLNDKAAMARIPWAEVSSVIHLAGAIPAKSVSFQRSNEDATRSLLHHLEGSSVTSFVLASSVSVYDVGAHDGLVVLHEANERFSEGAYAASKRAQENLCAHLASALCVFRPSSIYGTGMAEGTVLPTFVRRAQVGQDLEVRGARNYRQNFVCAADVARLMVDAAVRRIHGTYNLFSDTTMDMLGLAQRVAQAFGGHSAVIDRRDEGPWPDVVFDNSALVAQFAPRFARFEDAVREIDV